MSYFIQELTLSPVFQGTLTECLNEIQYYPKDRFKIVSEADLYIDESLGGLSS